MEMGKGAGARESCVIGKIARPLTELQRVQINAAGSLERPPVAELPQRRDNELESRPP